MYNIIISFIYKEIKEMFESISTEIMNKKNEQISEGTM